MKTLASFLAAPLAASLGLALCLMAGQAGATSVYWDTNGPTPGSGGPSPSGSWEDANWSTDSTGSSATANWTDGDFPIFAAGTDATSPFIVTVSGTHTIAGMQMLAPCTNVTINGSGSLNIADGLQGFFPNGAGLGVAGLWINVPLGGTGGLINQSSAGQLYLYGNNTYSGGTLFSANHIVYYNNNNSFGTGPITNTATGGLSLLTTNSAASSPNLPNDFYVNNGGGVFNFGSGNTKCSGHFYLQASPQLKNNGVGINTILEISGPIQDFGDSFGLTLQCTSGGTIKLTGNNTYTGKTQIGNGGVGNPTTVWVSSINSVSNPAQQAFSSLGVPADATAGTIDFGTTSYVGVMVYTGSGETSDRVINLLGTTGGATIQMDGTGPLVLTSDFTATGAGNKTLTLQGTSTAANAINGAIVDPSGFKTTLIKAQAGTWALGGANTYSGNTTVSAGTLRQGAANVVPFGGGKGNFVVSSGAKFDLAGFNATINGATTAGTVDNTTGTATFTVGNNGTAVSPAYSGVIQNTAPGVLNFAANCGGTLSLTSGGNTYSGYTAVSNAVLQITAENQLGSVPGSLAVADIILDSNLGWNPGTGANSGNYYLRLQTTASVDLSATRGIVLGDAQGYGGGMGAQSGKTLNVRGPISGPGGLWIGGGTQNAAVGVVALFNTGNTYSGGTYIVGGTLTLGDNNVLPTGTPLTLSDGAAVCNFDMNGKSQTIGPLTGFIPATPQVKLTGALTIIQNNNSTFNGIITQGGGSLTLAPTSTSTLTLGGTNTYTGPTTVGGGTLEIAAPNTGLASPTVSVASGATLLLDSPTALSSQASLLLASGSPVVNLNHGGTNQIGVLSFDGGATFAVPGTWGSSSSPAQHQDSRFTGGGVLAVQFVGSLTNRILSVTNNGNSSFTLNVQGTPLAQYYLVSQTNAAQPLATWPAVPGSTNTASDPSGLWSVTVTNPAPAFYRSRAINPGQ